MPSLPPKPPASSPAGSLPTPPRPNIGEFRPEKFGRQSTAKDYAIYAMVISILVLLVGGSIYYFSLPQPEQAKLRARLLRTEEPAEKAGADLDPSKQLERLAKIRTETVSPTPAVAAAPSGPVSTYAASRQGISVSDDPRLPKPSAAFLAFAEAMKISSVLQGNPPKAMLNGQLVRAGGLVDPALGIVFLKLDNNTLVLREKSGAELRVAY